MPTLAADKLQAFARSLFLAGGLPDNEADIVSRSLVDANLCGHDSHGLIRIPQYLKLAADGTFKPGAAFTVVKETPALVVADGGWGFGQVQAHRLLERLLGKAKQIGVAAGTLMNCGHIGRLGEYGEAAAKHNCALMATVNSHGYGRAVAPPGGIEGRIGTNPLCLSVPTKTDPVFLDIGTCVAAEGKVRVCFNKKAQTPDGWLLDENGKPTTDPGVLYRTPKGTILPLGGAQAYKGFGLGLLLDMFAGGFSGAPCSHPHFSVPGGNAVFFTLFNIELFAGAEHFLKEASEIADDVKNCPRAEGVNEIMLPGDPERKAKKQRLAEGIPLDDGTWAQLSETATQLKVAIPS